MHRREQGERVMQRGRNVKLVRKRLHLRIAEDGQLVTQAAGDLEENNALRGDAMPDEMRLSNPPAAVQG